MNSAILSAMLVGRRVLGEWSIGTNRCLWILAVVGIAGCPNDPDPPPLVEDVFGELGEIVPSATSEQRDTFQQGEAVARHKFTAEEGLGPTFNVTFCAACHEKPVSGGGASRYRNFLLVGQALDGGGRTELGANGVLPHFSLEDGRRDTDEGANHFALRNPIPFFGIGLLAEITEEEILSRADPRDANGDGIRGRPNFDRGFVGRFGRKAQTVSIEAFIRGPLNNHLGITSNPLSEESRARLPIASPVEVRDSQSMLVAGSTPGVAQPQAAAPDLPLADGDDAPDPELSEEDLFALVSWTMLLAAPEPEPLTDETRRGRDMFEAAQCVLCHAPRLNGPRGAVPAYTDLLLHDMGSELADGVTVGRASESEFRTQPLWGIAPVGPYLHDGRADTLDEAIRLHGGEAEASRDAYAALTDEERDALVAFLESLGGRALKTPGLLSPDAPVATDGYGAPLPDTEMDRFITGRALFDSDITLAGGLGPAFNGDGCRSCHFDPIIDGVPTVGGAGPAGVDVTRQAIVVDGMFMAPPGGTMAHRHLVASERPETNDDVTLIETRQTPTTLGMGLIDRIAEADIVANEDPDDMDGDGISGRVHELPDGRVGRFGWKGGVPSTAEFVRDAMFNELGMTTAEQSGLTFGGASDDDDVSDPEISAADMEAITYFLNQLAPPPRTSEDSAAETAGESQFETIGCADCHRQMQTSDGTAVNAFSDFLLHDIAPTDFVGIEDGMATMREFRTAPLWGLGQSAPYMHDGRSFTIEDAIARHESEASAARMAYEALSAAERAQVLAFLQSL